MALLRAQKQRWHARALATLATVETPPPKFSLWPGEPPADDQLAPFEDVLNNITRSVIDAANATDRDGAIQRVRAHCADCEHRAHKVIATL